MRSGNAASPGIIKYLLNPTSKQLIQRCGDTRFLASPRWPIKQHMRKIPRSGLSGSLIARTLKGRVTNIPRTSSVAKDGHDNEGHRGFLVDTVQRWFRKWHLRLNVVTDVIYPEHDGECLKIQLEMWSGSMSQTRDVARSDASHRGLTDRPASCHRIAATTSCCRTQIYGSS